MTALGPVADYDDLYPHGLQVSHDEKPRIEDEPLPTEPPADEDGYGCAVSDQSDQSPPAARSRRTSWTADELMRTTFPPTRWAVSGLVSEGVNLLVGAPKLGKSWLALGIGVAVASGGRALGRIDVEAGDVLYLALEDTGRRLQSRLSAVLGDDPAPARLNLATECAALTDGGASRIGLWLDEHPDARLVIVDVFTKIRGTTAGNEGRYESDYRAMSALKDLADEAGVAFLVVHHTRKAEATDFIDAVSGTQGLAGAADAILVLARSRGTAQAVLNITGRDVEEAEHALDFDAHTGTWSLLDGPASDYELGDTRRRILHLLRDGEARTPKAIALELSIKDAAARQSCKRMSEDGQLDNAEGAYWVPAPHLSPVTPVTLSLESDGVTRVTPDTGSLLSLTGPAAQANS